MAANLATLYRAACALGLSGLYLFAFGARAATTVAYLALLLLLLGFVVGLPRIWPRIRRLPVVWLTLAFWAYLALRTVWAVNEYPAYAEEQISEAMKLGQLWLFLVFAWWLGAQPRRCNRVVLVALAGFLVGIAHRTDLAELASVLAGARSGLGMPALALGLYTATGVLGLLILSGRFIGTGGPAATAVRLLLWLALLAVMLQGLVASQSRGSWLARLVVLPVILVARYRAGWSRLSRPRQLAAVALALVAVAGVSALLYANKDLIEKRMLVERDTIAAVLEGDTARIPYTPESSVGVRYHLTVHGFRQFAQRPLFGWGPASARLLIEQDPIAPLHKWVDLHNSYLEILVRVGLLGAAFFAVGAVLTVRSLRTARRQGLMADDWYYFLLGILALVAVWSAMDFRMTHSDWRFYWWIFGGIIYTFQLHAAARRGDGGATEGELRCAASPG